MDNLHVDIVTPVASVFSGDATEVVLPAWEGEMGVLPQHDALLTLVRAGRTIVKTRSGGQEWIIGRGFADIGGQHVTLLTDQAVAVADIDRSAAQTELDAANEVLNSDEDNLEVRKAAQIRAEWARALLEA